MESLAYQIDIFLAKSLMLDGDMNINRITFEKIDSICHNKLEALTSINNAIEIILNMVDSENGEKVLSKVKDKILELKEKQKQEKLRICKPLKKFKIPQGFTVYKMTAQNTSMLFGGRGVCDECGDYSKEGYYIPVLNHYQCQECFYNWTSYAKYYIEDRPIERMGIICIEKNCKRLGLKIEDNNEEINRQCKKG